MSDRTFRSLTALKSASTSRVLNLLAIGQLHAEDPGFRDNPLFSSPVINNAILLKHRLRADEVDLFLTPRAIVTKVIVPFEKHDLRSGGKSLMVGQRGYEELLRDLGNYGENRVMERDAKVLDLIDRIPSLDPFLLREHLRCNEILPDSHYFEISDADQRRMFDFASGQIRRLTDMAGGGQSKGDATSRMVAALLSSSVNEKLEPLRATLQLKEDQFREGVFSWRGFLYYKWSLTNFWPALITSLRQLKAIHPFGAMDLEQKVYIAQARESIVRGAKHVSDDIKATLGIYDQAYESLVQDQDAKKFREFLLNAPALFLEIGEKMGGLSHFTSFWQYRFPAGAPALVDAEELVTIFQDLSKSFAPNGQKAVAA
jgi:hypothetical protein